MFESLRRALARPRVDSTWEVGTPVDRAVTPVRERSGERVPTEELLAAPGWWSEAFGSVGSRVEVDPVIARLEAHFAQVGERVTEQRRPVFESAVRGRVAMMREALDAHARGLEPVALAPIVWDDERVARARTAAMAGVDPMLVQQRMEQATTRVNAARGQRYPLATPWVDRGPDGTIRVGTVAGSLQQHAVQRELEGLGISAHPEPSVRDGAGRARTVVLGWDPERLTERIAARDEELAAFDWHFGDAADTALHLARTTVSEATLQHGDQSARSRAGHHARLPTRHDTATTDLEHAALPDEAEGGQVRGLLDHVIERERALDRLNAHAEEIGTRVFDRYTAHRAAGLADHQAAAAVTAEVYGATPLARAGELHDRQCSCCSIVVPSEALSPVKGWCQDCEDNVAEDRGFLPEQAGERRWFTPQSVLDDPDARTHPDPIRPADGRPVLVLDPRVFETCMSGADDHQVIERDTAAHRPDRDVAERTDPIERADSATAETAGDRTSGAPTANTSEACDWVVVEDNEPPPDFDVCLDSARRSLDEVRAEVLTESDAEPVPQHAADTATDDGVDQR